MSFDQDVARAKKQLADLDARIGRSLPEIAKAGAIVLHDAAKQLAPVRTGKLKAGMKHRKYSKSATSAAHLVYNDVFYARYVEYGRKNGKGKRPFLRPAADTRQREIVGAMEAVALKEDGL